MQEVLVLLKSNLGHVVLGVLLLVSEVLGSSDKFKNSSIFQLIVGFLKSKDQEVK